MFTGWVSEREGGEISSPDNKLKGARFMKAEITTGLRSQLETMKSIPISEIDTDNLKELRDISIDDALPVRDRICSLIEQTGNPYFYKDGGVVVKVSFTDEGKTLQSILNEYLTAEILMHR